MSTVKKLDPKEVWEQLMLLKNMTEKTGMLHEAQVLQLKMWPLVVLGEYAKSVELDYNWEKHEVDYVVGTTSKVKPPEDLSKRLEILNKETKNLLGDSYLVRVRIRGKVIYRGMRLSDWTPPKKT